MLGRGNTQSWSACAGGACQQPVNTCSRSISVRMPRKRVRRRCLQACGGQIDPNPFAGAGRSLLRGLGLTLLEHLMSIAYKADARECFLEVRDSNRAAFSLYERYGFNEIGRRRDYYPAVGGREDAVVMACTLVD